MFTNYGHNYNFSRCMLSQFFSWSCLRCHLFNGSITGTLGQVLADLDDDLRKGRWAMNNQPPLSSRTTTRKKPSTGFMSLFS